MMMARPAEKAQRIRDELTCPSCSYSLRGLAGDVVTCPECGHECNIVAMMTRQWTGPWYDAPGFSKLLWPLVWLMIGSVLGLMALVIDASLVDGPGAITVVWYLLVVVVWLALLGNVIDIPTKGKGIGLSMLGHGLFVGYITGIVIVVWAIVSAISSRHVVLQAVFLGLIAVGASLFWLMRRGEKYIAQRCIQAWVNQPAAPHDA